MTPFNPEQLTPAASLNRMRIVDLPGIALDPEVRGRTAYELLSTAALAASIRDQAGVLALPDLVQLHDAALPPLLDRCFASADPTVRDAAEAVAVRAGRALGFLLLVLTRGDPASRAARDDWDDSYWTYWGTIRRVLLGGGLVGGALGQHLVAHTQALLMHYGAECSVEIADHPQLLPLLGAARSLAVDHGTALVCDFGQSRVKRGCAVFAGGKLVALRTLPPMVVDWAQMIGPALEEAERASRLAGAMAHALETTLDELGAYELQVEPYLGISIASYVADGRPLLRQGGPYSQMHALELPLDRQLAARLSEQMQQPATVTLLHDGTAAARAYAETATGATIMLGTALGVGFSRASAALRSLSLDFGVRGRR